METIIPFRTNTRTLRPRGFARDRAFGEVVIFPGVRMERHGGGAADADLDAPAGESADGSGRPRKTS